MSRLQLERQYEEILQGYLNDRGEDQLYLGHQLSKWLIRHNVAPEDIIDLHLRALERTVELPERVRDSFQLLTEVMVGYGIAYREHISLRDKQQRLEAEIEVAASMQQTLLPSGVPRASGLEIGLVSVPAKRMSGDYYNFVKRGRSLSVAIADIAGKGVPAALCMSMIKYAMDTILEPGMSPGEMLAHLNSVVERNIDPSMFVTMCYGRYDTVRHRFRYAVAGHEPGFWYRARDSQLVDLEGEGLVLGVRSDASYREYVVDVEPDDMIILLTDGVHERKIGGQYLMRSDLAGMIREEIGSSAQELAESLYRRLLSLSDFELPDDHTMIVMRRLG